MAKHRIVQRPSFLNPSSAVYDVEEKVWFSWEPRGTFDKLEEAKKRVFELKKQEPYTIKRKVIRVYE